MLRVGKDAGGVARLDDLAEVHHRHAGADVAHEPQIVRDEEVGQLQPLLQIEQQVDDLRLNRDVERGDRLVGDDEGRVERQRARQADALALPAAELVRIAFEMRRVEADQARTAPPPARAARCGCRSDG